MNTSCRISACNWYGSVHMLQDHCESKHPACIRESQNQNFYDFQLKDLEKDAFLLKHPNGLYWFCEDDSNKDLTCLKKSVFHVGESQPVEYTLKLGLIKTGYAEYWGPFQSCSDETYRYDLIFPFEYLQFANINLSHEMRLYFGEFDDSDDTYDYCSEEVDWNEEEENLNKICLKKFTCPVCLEFIRKNARFCARNHYVCLQCYENMEKKKPLKCPICRESYAYDNKSEKIEELLRAIKFPIKNIHES